MCYVVFVIIIIYFHRCNFCVQRLPQAFTRCVRIVEIEYLRICWIVSQCVHVSFKTARVIFFNLINWFCIFFMMLIIWLNAFIILSLVFLFLPATRFFRSRNADSVSFNNRSAFGSPTPFIFFKYHRPVMTNFSSYSQACRLRGCYSRFPPFLFCFSNCFCLLYQISDS